MTTLKKTIKITLFLFVFALIPLDTFVQSEPKRSIILARAEGEIWELSVTGDTKSKCEMVLRQSETEKDIYLVSGKFSGKINDEQWGPGSIRFNLKGKTTKSVFVAEINGYANMEEGEAAVNIWPVWGKMKGTLSESQGSGTWSARHEFGSPSGEWTAKRIR